MLISADFMDFRPDFSGQDFFDINSTIGRKPEAYAAVGTYVAGNGDQLAGDAHFFKEFFCPHGMTY